MGGVSIISGTLFRVRQEPFLTSKIIMLVIIIFTFYKKKYYLISSLSGLFFLFSMLFFSHVTVDVYKRQDNQIFIEFINLYVMTTYLSDMYSGSHSVIFYIFL